MVTRYDVAMLLRQHWPLLNWKGDDHTAGVYFDEEYGYMVETSYAVRMNHEEPTSPAFYIPANGDDEGEVIVTFPYRNMKKRPSKYQPLFTKNELTQKDLTAIFSGEPEREIEVQSDCLITFLETIKKKRERDQTWLRLKRHNARLDAALFQKHDNQIFRVEQMGFTTGHSIEKDELFITVNSNTFLHALKLFSWGNTVSIAVFHDRIRITHRQLVTGLEAVLSLPKKTIQREIESF